MALFAFDLDDTLYKERDYVASGRMAVAAEAASRTGGDTEAYFTLMASAADPFGALEARVGDAMSIPEMVEVYRSHIPQLALDPAVESVLHRLRSRGHVLALITDGDGARQRAKIHALGLERFFGPNMIISGETGADKHSPLPFELAARIAPGQPRFYTGDNPEKDFLHPNMLGWTTVMLRDIGGVNIHRQNVLRHRGEFRARYTVDTLATLLGFPTI